MIETIAHQAAYMMHHGNQTHSEIMTWTVPELRLRYLSVFAVVADDLKARAGQVG